MRFPHLAHRSAAAHKLHSTPQQDRMNLISGNRETSSRLQALAYSSPEAVQTTGTVAYCDGDRMDPARIRRPALAGRDRAERVRVLMTRLARPFWRLYDLQAAEVVKGL